MLDVTAMYKGLIKKTRKETMMLDIKAIYDVLAPFSDVYITNSIQKDTGSIWSVFVSTEGEFGNILEVICCTDEEVIKCVDEFIGKQLCK